MNEEAFYNVVSRNGGYVLHVYAENGQETLEAYLNERDLEENLCMLADVGAKPLADAMFNSVGLT